MSLYIDYAKHYSRLLIALGCLFCATQPLRAQASPTYVLTQSAWSVPRTTQSVLAMPALQKTVRAYDKHPKSHIQIHYPGGDEGTLWAAELRSWLVSLGVASRHIELLPGTRKSGQLELQVVTPEDFDQTHD